MQDQSKCLPQLDYLSFLAQASTSLQEPWDSNWQTELERFSGINQNGTFRFNTDLAFDALDPRTYPERLTIRVPDAYRQFVKNHTFEGFLQDKWRIGRATLSAGIRYDVEVIPLDQRNNPLFTGSGKDYAVDKNNVAPRLGFTYALDEENRSVVRAGYGLFYNRTILGAIDDVIEFPFLDRALLNRLYPPGSQIRNGGVVTFDGPNRQTPYAHQMTLGYTLQIGASMAVSADLVKSMNRDMFLARNLNPMRRVDTTRTGALTRSDAFGVLGDTYNQQVWVMENTGENNFDNPSGDRRVPATYLVLTNLRGGGGFPRQAQFGLRYQF